VSDKLVSFNVNSGTFMARAARGDSSKLKVTSKDSDEEVGKQWNQFRVQCSLLSLPPFPLSLALSLALSLSLPLSPSLAANLP
jgi:hypothetical protein